MLVNECKVKPVCAGQKTKKIGHLDVGKVVWDSEQEIQPIIQSYGEACKIENIIARMSLGDVTALSSKGEGVYLTEEQAKALNSDPVALNKQVTDIYLNAYKQFAGRDNVAYNEFVNLMRQGKFEELAKFVPKEESHE